MIVRPHEIDSEILGAPVLELRDIDYAKDLTAIDDLANTQPRPGYLFTRVPSREIRLIQQLEFQGFRFVEFQFRSELRLRRDFPVDDDAYRYEIVSEKADLPRILEIAATAFTDDRFTVDPELPPGAGGERYRRFVEKSFASPDELLHRLVNRETAAVIGFNSCAPLDGHTVQLYLGAVAKEYQATGLGVILNYFAFNDLRHRGFQQIVTHQSGCNHPIINVEIGHFGFKVVETYVVLRKLGRTASGR